MEFTITGYSGISYLTKQPDVFQSSAEDETHFKKIRSGFNYGTNLMIYYKKIGVGFNFDAMKTSSNDWEWSTNEIVDERIDIIYFGPILSVKNTISHSHLICANISLGRQIFKDYLTIDSEEYEATISSTISKFSVDYKYRLFQNLSLGANFSYFNGRETGVITVSSVDRTAGFGSGRNRFRERLNLDRLTLGVQLVLNL